MGGVRFNFMLLYKALLLNYFEIYCISFIYMLCYGPRYFII
jgi:hypothetical protein